MPQLESNQLLHFSIYTPNSVRMQDTEKDPHCSPLWINLVNSQLNQLENDLFGKIITIKSY